MEIGGVIERVERIASVVRSDPGAAGADLIETGLVAVREVQAWCDAQHAGLVARLAEIDSFPEQRIANASKTVVGPGRQVHRTIRDAGCHTGAGGGVG
jgi:hypothetical protein